MGNLAWALTLPVASVVIGMLWVWWRTHPRPPADTADSMAEYQRFRQALESAEKRSVP